MSNSYFKFKHFTIEQNDCAMKVGTDGCLLGSWFNCNGSKRILDIGCGTGLITLMAAQRSNAEITGIEIDSKAAQQATTNVSNSPWRERVRILHSDFLEYTDEAHFDAIVSNPPYFVNSLKCDDTSRTLARHSDTLDSRMFFKKCAELLSNDGHISIVIPCNIIEEWKSSAIEQNLYPTRTTFIKTTPNKAPKRVLIEFRHGESIKTEEETLILEVSRGEYSNEAKSMLKDFYLKL